MNMHRLPMLAQRVLNTPLAIHPGKAEMILSAVGHRFGITGLAPGLNIGDWDDDGAAPEGAGGLAVEPYDMLQGIAIIPIEGTLVHKNCSVRPYSGMTGYDGIRSAFTQAMADDEARAIVLHIDSPGGEVAGCFDLADMIYAARGRKPIWAILDEVAYSAAYALASSCDRVIAPRTGGAGSIGIVAVLVEMSRLMAREGVTANIIQFGARKADGNPYQALPPAARKKFQADVDALGALFCGTVGRNRRLKPLAVKALEAATFSSSEALRVGLVDAIMAPAEALAALQRTLPAPNARRPQPNAGRPVARPTRVA